MVRAIEDVRDGKGPAWARDLAAEAARIEEALREDRRPLSADAAAMYAILCSLPETEGRRAKDLVGTLLPKFSGIDEDRIRRCAQELVPYGIQRTGAAGYYVPLSARPPRPPST
jgi:hypothetical protein